MQKDLIHTILLAGDDASVQCALGELIARAMAEAGGGQTIVLTAADDVEVLHALSRGRIDLVVADFGEEGRGIDLLGWLSYGKFPARTLLLTCQGLWGAWRAKGVDAAVKRPATVKELVPLLAEWLA